MAIQDQIRGKINELTTLRDISTLLIHTNGADGINRNVYLKIYDVLYDCANFDVLDVVLNSLGGDIESAYKICKLLRRKSNKINVIVPHFAKSAATLLCINADNIILSPKGELGPLYARFPDTRNRISALARARALEYLRTCALETIDVTVRSMIQCGLTIEEAANKRAEMVDKACNPLMCKIDPMRMGEYERILSIAEDYGFRLLKNRMSENNAMEILEKIIERYPNHTFVIDMDKINELGLVCEEPTSELSGILENLDMLLMSFQNNFIELNQTNTL